MPNTEWTTYVIVDFARGSSIAYGVHLFSSEAEARHGVARDIRHARLEARLFGLGRVSVRQLTISAREA